MRKLIKAFKARDLSIKNAKKKFIEEIKEETTKGRFNHSFVCFSESEVNMYMILAKAGRYNYDVFKYGNNGSFRAYVDVTW